MKFQKALSGLLVTGLILSNGITVFASPQMVVEKKVQVIENTKEDKDTQISEEKARELAKKYIQEFFVIDIDEGQYQINIQNREDMGLNYGSNVWYLNLHKYNKDTSLSLDVSINADNGKLISINKWEHNRLGESQISKFTKNEAKSVAQEFLKKQHSDIVEYLELDERNTYSYYPQGEGLRPTDYRFNFVRHHDGIPVLSDGVNIGVNSGTGEVTSYSFMWTNEELPEKANIISKENAQEILEKALDVGLNYISIRDMNSPYYDQIKEVKLGYSPKYENGPLIDANSGEFINYSGANNEVKKRDLTNDQKLEIDKLTKNNKAKEISSKEEASKRAEEILKEIYDEDIKISNVNYSSNDRMNNKPYKVWEVRFMFDDTAMSEGHMSLDASTGNVMNVNYYNWRTRELVERGEETVDPKLTWEEAYDKAIEVLKEIHPNKLKSIETEQTYRESYYYYNDKQIKDVEYHFNFARKENEVIFNNNSLSISFDNATGRLQNIYMNWDDIELPKVENIMDKEEAKNIFLDQLDVRLVYSYIYPNGVVNRTKPDIKLVYSNQPKGDFAQYNLIDAKTGSFMDYNGQEKVSTDLKNELLDNLSNHWAYKELKIMAERNIIDLENVKLEDKVTKKQALKMIVNAKGNTYYGGSELQELKFTDIDEKDPDYRTLQLAVEYGLIDNTEGPFEMDKYITREELAEMLIKSVNLKKVASIDGVYTIPVLDAEDISNDKFGYVALGYGLEIIKGGEENYLPKEEVDLIQVAVAIYRTMETMGNYFR